MSQFVYIEAFACDENGEGPAFAKVNVTPEFIAQLVSLKQVVAEHNLSEARVFCDPEEWQNEDEFRLRSCELCVVADAFWFHANPKHADYSVETRSMDIEPFIEAAANGVKRFGEEYDEEQWDDLLEVEQDGV